MTIENRDEAASTHEDLFSKSQYACINAARYETQGAHGNAIACLDAALRNAAFDIAAVKRWRHHLETGE